MQTVDEAPARPDEDSPITGLTDNEAAERRAKGQGNKVPPPTGRTYWQIITQNAFTFINISLFFLGFALLLLGRPLDALTSTAVISLNILVSVVQEIRAKRTLDRIALLTRPEAVVLRDGKERSIRPEDLVIGDILKIGPGDQVVVDGTVAGDGRMALDESQLTGESDLIQKKAGDPVYSGSFCVSGSGYYRAEKVGENSVANQITSGARAFRRVLTPLQQEMNLVIRIMLLIVIYLEFLLFLNAVLKKIDLAESVQNSALIAALVPNGLFLSISIAYALGAVRILRFGALVQQSNAIESMSNVDVLCLDKTGTLTANRLTVHGVVGINTTEDDLRAVLGDMVSSISTGNKTSEAIQDALGGQKRRSLGEVPFSSARKWSAVSLDDDGPPMRRGIYALGAPEMLRPYLGSTSGAGLTAWETLATKAAAMTDQGLRVLLVAHSPEPMPIEDKGDGTRLPTDMTPLGLVSLEDELRPEARETLQSFIAAGVYPKIISGDNPETVAALARQAGLGPEIKLISGLELDGMDDDQFRKAAAGSTIFGRITPQQKERLVRALRDQGHYVAMIGDGVNDVLSLKQANLGIAMQSGSQATRGVADIVLLKDSFAVLAPAVQEGQRIINGMYDILKLFLTRVSTVGLVILSSMVVGEFPLALRQGSVVTLLTVAVPTVMLAVWASPGPLPRGMALRRLAHFVLSPALVTTVLGLVLFYATLLLLLVEAHAFGSGVSTAQFNHLHTVNLQIARTTLAAFLTICGLLLVIFVQPPSKWWVGGDVLSGDRRPTYLAIGLMISFVAIMAISPLRHLFALSPLGLTEVALILALVAIWTVSVRLAWRYEPLARFLGVSDLVALE